MTTKKTLRKQAEKWVPTPAPQEELIEWGKYVMKENYEVKYHGNED